MTKNLKTEFLVAIKTHFVLIVQAAKNSHLLFPYFLINKLINFRDAQIFGLC